MEKAYNLIIVDDHSIFRDAIKFVLTQSDKINIIGEAASGYEFLDLIEDTKPDLVLMDIAMPGLDGVETTKEAIRKYPDLKVIALSLYGEEPYYYRMVEAGAQGFVVKDSGSDELLKAIGIVMNGESYFSNHILCNIIKEFPEKEDQTISAGKEVKLSKRESEILDLICDGLSNSEIADKLGVSRRTVEGHRYDLIAKTGAKSTIQLVLYAMKNRTLVN
jgi:DNA-binding NarL/FixJ family response regulator